MSAVFLLCYVLGPDGEDGSEFFIGDYSIEQDARADVSSA